MKMKLTKEEENIYSMWTDVAVRVYEKDGGFWVDWYSALGPHSTRYETKLERTAALKYSEEHKERWVLNYRKKTKEEQKKLYELSVELHSMSPSKVQREWLKNYK